MGKTLAELTSTELELMLILWEIEKGSVRDIMDKLPKERNLAYTSVSTMVRILERKGFVGSEKAGRGHQYSPLLSKEEYEKSSVNSLVDNVFEGAPLSLVKCLIEEKKISEKDLNELRELLRGEK